MSTHLLSRRRFIASTVAESLLPDISFAADAHSTDVCVYGGTASGVMAAVTAV